MENNRTPPQDLDSEMALLGAMLVYQMDNVTDWTFEQVEALVSAESFYVPQHSHLFTAIIQTYKIGDPIDYIAVTSRLDDVEDWAARLDDLTESYADVANALFYAKCIRRDQIKREVIRQCVKTSQLAYEAIEEPEDLIANLSKTLDRLNRACVIDRVPILESELIKSIVHNPEKEIDFIPVALGDVGFTLGGGFDRGSLTVVGARPSCGKTSLAVCVAYHASRCGDGVNTLFVSAEMTAKQIAVRFISIRTGIPVKDMKGGAIDSEYFDQQRDQAAVEADSGRLIYIIDQIDGVGEIVAQTKNSVRKQEVGLVIIDYLGLLRIAGKYDRNDIRVGEMVKAFKKLAISENIAVMLLVQLNRDVEHGSGRAPRMSDLRDSGEIEQHSDVILLINPTGKASNVPGDLVDVEILIEKQRQGSTGKALLSYKKSTMSFCTNTVEVYPEPQLVPANDKVPF